MEDLIRPTCRLLSPGEVERVAADALTTLAQVGVFVENATALALLAEAGLPTSPDGRVRIGEAAVRQALATAPRRVRLYDRERNLALDLGEDRVHFDPGSAALHLHDPALGRHRPPTSRDLVELAWVTEACCHIQGQATALIPADVNEALADRFRLYVALLHSQKPITTGTFRKDGFHVMAELLLAVRGSAAALREWPLAIFDCCPTPPLKWSDLTAQALLDCAALGIPAELISMPLGGATAPVTLREMVVQHAAESLSGVVLHQLAGPGAPIIWGGSPAVVDMRYGTTPMGAIETMMVDMANAQLGKHFGLPTHAYMALSDAAGVDWQAGMESGIGAVLAALAGINIVSGPGMLDFESAQSLEKLILDNEACGMALRLVQGIRPRTSGSVPELFGEVVAADHFLGHPHTRTHFRQELLRPGKVIHRSSYGDWLKHGAKDALAMARAEVEAIRQRGNTRPVAPELRGELTRIMQQEFTRLEAGSVPELP